MSHLKFSILASSTNFCPFRTDLSGNAIWPQASDFYNFTKLTILMNFCPIKMLNETFSVIFNHCVLKMSVPFLKKPDNNPSFCLSSFSSHLTLSFIHFPLSLYYCVIKTALRRLLGCVPTSLGLCSLCLLSLLTPNINSSWEKGREKRGKGVANFQEWQFMQSEKLVMRQQQQ